MMYQTLFVQSVKKKLKLPYTAKSKANNALKLSIIKEESECPSEKVTHKTVTMVVRFLVD